MPQDYMQTGKRKRKDKRTIHLGTNINIKSADIFWNLKNTVATERDDKGHQPVASALKAPVQVRPLPASSLPHRTREEVASVSSRCQLQASVEEVDHNFQPQVG